MARAPWNHENMFETGVKFELTSVNHSAVKRNNKRDIFSIFYNMKVCCVFSLESPNRGDYNGYTQYTIFNIENRKAP